MRLIIAGSRSITDYRLVARAVDQFLTEHRLTPSHIEAVASGKEPRGVDALGERWAANHCIPVLGFEANWDRHGKAAGPIRNQAMIDWAQLEDWHGDRGTGALVAVWNGQSPGTANVIALAASQGLRLGVLRVDRIGPGQPMNGFGLASPMAAVR